MIISREEADKQIEFIRKGLKTTDENAVTRIYAKWYAGKVIDRCTEKAELIRRIEGSNPEVIPYHIIYAYDCYYKDGTVEINKQSILNVKEEL